MGTKVSGEFRESGEAGSGCVISCVGMWMERVDGLS